MLDPRTLRGRLTLTYASALALALLLFAVVSLVILDRTQRGALDQQLATAARATGAIIDVQNGTIALEEVDRVQFRKVLGIQLNGAILARDGTILVSSSTELPNGVEYLANAGLTGLEIQTIHSEEDLLRVAAAPVPRLGPQFGTIVVWRDEGSLLAIEHGAILAFAIAIPLIVALAILAGGQLAQRALSPLTRIAGLAADIEAHDLTARIALPPRDDELGRFCATFDRMLDRLQAAFDRERRFTSDASHELRTPLSVIRAEADLALRRRRAPDEYRRALETIAQEADELEHLTSDLLAAARAQSDSTAPSADCDLAVIAGDVAGRLRVLAGARNITIDAQLAPAAIVRGQREELARVVVALVHNAVKYAPDGGRVEVGVERSAHEVVLRVTDDGPGFSEEALAHAFDRFWQDDTVRSRDGSGLGLAITRALVTQSGGGIELANRPTGGGLVTVRFPAGPP
ncbi:MAG: sensor histidine kinase, partial [Vulcanimicrobiaceae bacterium]